MELQKTVSKKLRIVEGLRAKVEPDVGAFPMEFFQQEFSPSTYQLIDWHWHTGVQFCYVTKGTFQFQVVRDTIRLAEGEGIFINAQQVHTALPEGTCGEYLCLNISPYLLGLEGSGLYQQYMAPVIFQSPVPYLIFQNNGGHTGRILKLLVQCSREAQQADGQYGLVLLAHLILLWDELRNVLPESGSWEESSKNNSRMQSILQYLQDNYTRKISLQEIADHVHLSRSECSRFFRSVSGRPLFQYLAELRVNHSIELLAHTDKSITEIAYETGFGSQSYFNQRFRMIKGMPPDQFRKSLFQKERGM